MIRRRVPILIKEEIEPAHFVWTVVRTILGADAAVVNHVVQAFCTVHCRVNRTDRFARRVLAMHARHRHEIDALWMIRIEAFVVSIDANPMHLAATHNFVFTDNRNIVF